MRRLTRAAIAAVSAGTIISGCANDSGANGGGSVPTSAPAKQSCPPGDNGYSWCSNGPDNQQQQQPSAHPTFTGSGPIRFGDWMFGDCSLSLWPPYTGLTLHASGNLVILASTACVGYQVSEIHVHLTLQRWWNPGGSGHYDWYDTGVKLADNTIPPLVILPKDNEVPLSHQHQISGAVKCTPNPSSKAVPYRLLIDIVGVSYGGSPIVTGGYSAAYVITGWDCL